MLLAFALQWQISSTGYHASLYGGMIISAVLCSPLFFCLFRTYVGIIRFSSFVDILRLFVCITVIYGLLGTGNFCWPFF